MQYLDEICAVLGQGGWWLERQVTAHLTQTYEDWKKMSRPSWVRATFPEYWDRRYRPCAETVQSYLDAMLKNGLVETRPHEPLTEPQVLEYQLTPRGHWMRTQPRGRRTTRSFGIPASGHVAPAT